MPRLTSVASLLKDSPPAYAFELSEAGVAAAQVGRTPKIAFAPIEKDVISISPVHDNVLRLEALLAQVRAVAPGDGGRRRRRAALILPDYAVRVTVLDFDEFPTDAKEQAALVRFRMKRSVPFDVDSAAMSYHPQREEGNGKRVDVVVAIAPGEIVARYEMPFRMAGFHVGWVTTSTLAVVDLVAPAGVKVLAKRAGRVLSLAVLAGGTLKLIRSIELNDCTAGEIAGHLHPTLAYVEDQLAAIPDVVLLCGFGEDSEAARLWLESELQVRVATLATPQGEPGEYSAGLTGYLESLKES
jgi:type IV pilus assembly protein PilM